MKQEDLLLKYNENLVSNIYQDYNRLFRRMKNAIVGLIEANGGEDSCYKFNSYDETGKVNLDYEFYYNGGRFLIVSVGILHDDDYKKLFITYKSLETGNVKDCGELVMEEWLIDNELRYTIFEFLKTAILGDDF